MAALFDVFHRPVVENLVRRNRAFRVGSDNPLLLRLFRLFRVLSKGRDAQQECQRGTANKQSAAQTFTSLSGLGSLRKPQDWFPRSSLIHGRAQRLSIA